MNKSGLIEALALEAGISAQEAGRVADTILAAMAESLAAGDNVELRGFGSFAVKEYESYYGHNPKTGEKIRIGAKKLPFFKAGKGLKEKVNR